MKSFRLAFWIGLFLFSVYLLSFSGKLHVMDEFVGFAVGNNLAQHGRADVNQFIWTNHWHSTPPGIWGKDNNLYTKKAPGVSLAAIPFIWLGHTLPNLNAVHLSLLVSLITTALTGSLLFIWLIDLRFSRSIAALVALAYGLSTLAWVYARFLWEHSLMAFIFLTVFWALYRLHQRPDRATLAGKGLQNQNRFWMPGWLLLCGAMMALSLSMRFEAIFALGWVGLYIFLTPPAFETLSLQNLGQILRDKSRWARLALYAALPLAAILGLLYFNYIRFGSISETGYNREILFHKPWEGSFGLLFSPSTGLFIYAPVTLLLLWGIGPARNRLPRLYFWLILLLTLFYWLFYGSWFSWGSTWVWGPRFMLHTLPLLMLFVAEALAWGSKRALLTRGLIWGGAILLIAAGFIINFLGIIVDLNEHFLRLGRNDNFVFNWAAFPPLGHWRILQEGLVDLIWLQPGPDGLTIHWPVLTPALILFLIAFTGLLFAYKSRQKESPNRPSGETTKQSLWENKKLGIENNLLKRAPAYYALRITFHVLRSPLLPLLFTILLVYQVMLAAAEVSLAGEQARADQPLFDTLAGATWPGDALLVSMPPFGDVQEISTHLMAYLDQPIPAYAWIESEPKAIQPEEREQVWQAVGAEARRIWLFERWLTQKDPLSLTAGRLNQIAFPVQEWWFERSGKLTLYALAQEQAPAILSSPGVPFQGGLKLVDFAVFGDKMAPGEIVKVRLTWQAGGPEQLAASLPEPGIVSFIHLIDEASARNVAQNDRLLLDPQQFERSPLHPNQTISLGYGLRLPDDLPPGSYPLITGLYQAATGQRLQRADDNPDDFLYLTNIAVRWNN